MCGIVGFVDKNKRTDIIDNMLEVQSHRGPDDRGEFFDKKTGVHFGHNRLSIQDLSSYGHQPFISACTNYIIVFNGEVYNFKTIRNRLIKLGYKFISQTDTEVILYSYKQWGTKCVNHLVGMFAFSILDRTQNKLILVRDRAGVKPLYYYTNKNQFIFSSELKSFHEHPKFKKKQNLSTLPYFFQFGYIPSPYTIFENCFKLEAGNYLELKLDNFEFKVTKYWDVNDFYLKDKINKNENEIIMDLEGLLEDAINLRMISDVPVGVFLSGGHDSSLVLSILNKTHNRKINTFTIGFEDNRYNEAKDAKAISKYLGTNHTEYYMKDCDMLELVELLPCYYDEPFGDSSALPTIILSRLAKENVKVALSADGGDEAFCGYSKYFYLDSFKNILSSKFKKLILETTLNIFGPNSIERINDMLPNNKKQKNIKDKYKKFKRAVNSDSLEEMFENASSYEDIRYIKKFLIINRDRKVYEKWKNINNLDFLDHMMAIDYKLFMSDDVLTKIDRATMSASLEGREPLLDHRIIEYLARVPKEIKYKNNEGKYLLKKLLYKYLPKQLVDRQKSGFQIPLNSWLRGKLKPLVVQYLDNSKLDSNIFDLKEIDSLKKRFFSGEDLGTTVWFILMYQMWKEKWL